MQANARAVMVAAPLGALLLILCVGSGAPVTMTFDRPDSATFDGLRDEREQGGRWTRPEATIAPGLVAAGEVELTLALDRGARLPAEVVLTHAGQQRRLVAGENESVARFTASGPVRVQVNTESRNQAGVRLKSFSVVPKGPGALLPSPGLAARMATAAALIALALIFAGLTPSMAAAGSALLWSLPVALFGWTNPYVTVRLIGTLWWIAPLFTFALALLKRRLRTSGVLLGTSAALLRLMLLFHPDWYYRDLEIHGNVTRALAEEGRVAGWMNMDDLQQRFDLGRASVSGFMRPLPYPPLFHTLASAVPDSMTVTAMKSLGVAAATATILLTLLIARRWFDSETAGLLAGLAMALLPSELLELLRVSFPAILGRLLDLVAVAFLLFRSADLDAWRGRLTLGAWLGLCCLAYNAAPVHFGLFIPLVLVALSLPPSHSREARGLLSAASLGALLSLLFYGRYVFDLVFSVLAGNRAPSASVDWMGVAAQLIREHGPLLVAALVAAPLCLRETWRRAESRILLAWILWVPLIVSVAALFPGPFGYFRQQFFAYPLFALLAARWVRGPAWVSRVLVVAMAIWGIVETAQVVPGMYITHTGRIGD